MLSSCKTIYFVVVASTLLCAQDWDVLKLAVAKYKLR